MVFRALVGSVDRLDELEGELGLDPLAPGEIVEPGDDAIQLGSPRI